jgi:hypothetical protein
LIEKSNHHQNNEKEIGKQCRKKVPIPAWLWTFDVSRDPGAFAQADPIERFYEVNRSLAEKDCGVSASKDSSPASSSSSSSLRQHKVGVLDLHFQSARTVEIVLDTLLDSELAIISQAKPPKKDVSYSSRISGGGSENNEEKAVWLITGTGHHTGQTHVKAGALFDAVEFYLINGAYEFAYGKDGSGRSGAFAVYRKKVSW